MWLYFYPFDVVLMFQGRSKSACMDIKFSGYMTVWSTSQLKTGSKQLQDIWELERAS
jgi:hypothetical protein